MFRGMNWPAMSIKVTCDECSELHRVREDAVGKQFVCKGCGKLLPIVAPAVSQTDFTNFVEDVLDDDDDSEPHQKVRKVRPTKPPGKLVCRFHGSRSVIVDYETRMIHFQNCHTPRTFFPVAPASEFICPVTDLRAVHRVRIKNKVTLTVVTRTGSAEVPASAVNFVLLERCLRANLPEDGPVVSGDHPLWLPMCALSGGLGGLFAGLFLSSKNARDNVFGVYLLGGTMAGIIFVFLLRKLAQLSASEEESV